MFAADAAVLTNASDVAAMIMKPSPTSCGFELRAKVLQTHISENMAEIAVEDDTGGVIVKSCTTRSPRT